MTGLAGTKSYSMYVPDNQAFADCNYNNYYVSGTYGVLGMVGSGDVTSLAALIAATGKDANSANTAVQFLNPTTTDLHLDGASLSNMSLLCPTIPAVSVDFDDIARKTRPDHKWVQSKLSKFSNICSLLPTHF